MGRTIVLYDGVDLTAGYVVSDLRRSLLPRVASSVDVPGMDGALFTGARMGVREVALTMIARSKDAQEREAAGRALAAAIDADSPRPLQISIDGGLWLMALAESGGDSRRYTSANSFEVTFRAFDPVFWGEERTVTVPSGGSVGFHVGGTAPTAPVVEAPAAANGPGGFWRLRKEDGTDLMATIPEQAGTAPLRADCLHRTLYVNDAAALLVPAADWLVLEPGDHTLTMTGTGAATVTFHERWL